MKAKFNGVYLKNSLNELWSTENGTLSEMGIFLLLLLVPFSFASSAHSLT